MRNSLPSRGLNPLKGWEMSWLKVNFNPAIPETVLAQIYEYGFFPCNNPTFAFKVVDYIDFWLPSDYKEQFILLGYVFNTAVLLETYTGKIFLPCQNEGYEFQFVNSSYEQFFLTANYVEICEREIMPILTGQKNGKSRLEQAIFVRDALVQLRKDIYLIDDFIYFYNTFWLSSFERYECVYLCFADLEEYNPLEIKRIYFSAFDYLPDTNSTYNPFAEHPAYRLDKRNQELTSVPSAYYFPKGIVGSNYQFIPPNTTNQITTFISNDLPF